ncbi:MAG: hypothetical protein V4669_15835 [Pseudomonadota bacterium]
MTAAQAAMALAFIAGIRTTDSQGSRPTQLPGNPDIVDEAGGLSMGTPVVVGTSVFSDRQLLSLSANDTQFGFVINAPTGSRVFLLGDPPPPGCEPTLRGEYGNVTQRSIDLICPEDNGTVTAHNTYLFSQAPNYTYLERGPRDRAASLCSGPVFDPLNPPDTSGTFEGTELVQPWSMYRFAYVDRCTTHSPTTMPSHAGSNTPTSAGQEASSTQDPSGGWALTAAAGVGLAGSIVICAYRGRLQCRHSQFRQVQPEPDLIEMADHHR